MNIVFMSMDTLPSTLWARDLYDQMHIRSDFRKWFPRMCQYGFIEGRDYEYMPRVRLQDEGGRTVQRYVKDYRITQDMAKKLCKLHHTAVGAAYHRDAAVAASTGDIPSVRHRVQHAWRYAWWTVLHSGKESTRKAVKIENNMIYWGKRD